MSVLNKQITINPRWAIMVILIAAIVYAVFMVSTNGYTRFVIEKDHLRPVNVSVWNRVHDLLGWKKHLLLTFDDGPSGMYIERSLVDVLSRHHAHAIFFINCIHLYNQDGSLSSQKVAALKYASSHGNLIGNHSFSHPDLIKLAPASMQQQITRCNSVITQVTGQVPHYFRPPFGATNAEINRFVESLGMQQVLWRANSFDFMVHEPAMIEHYSLFEVTDNAILDMHETGPTAAALDDLLTRLERRGYQFVLPVRPDTHSAGDLVQP